MAILLGKQTERERIVYITSFIGQNMVECNVNQFDSKSKMLTHVEELLKIWNLEGFNFEPLIDETLSRYSQARRIYLDNNNYLLVMKVGE